nr:MAG TPA: copper amine oxidase [Caudoviricetes sp.]
MKKFFAGMLTMLLILCLGGSVLATTGKVQQEIEYRDIQVSLNGKILDLKDAKGNTVEPFMFAGTNYIPARALAEALGLNVSWDGKNATVVLAEPAERTATYITRTGSKYHSDPHCNGGTYWEVPRSTAVGMGLKPCDKCIG